MGITTDNSRDVGSLLSPDVVLTVQGQGPLAGVFRGPEQVYEHIDKLFNATSGTFEVLKWVDWLLGLSHIAALQFAQAQGRGMIYRNHHMFLIETGDTDLLTQIQVFFENQIDANTFFANLLSE
jgi:ketosteroid isomerase-like protein